MEKVDKSSNFKCAWCGVNLMERHHIEPYLEGGQNVSENLILLCSNCHTLVHQGKISNQELVQRRKRLSGEVYRSSGFLSLNKEYAFRLGGNIFINTPNIINHNGENLVKIKTQHNNLVISLRIYNKKRSLICWMEDLINVSGSLYLNGYLMKFDKEDIKYFNPSYPQKYSLFKNNTFKNCGCAFRFDT